MLNTRLKKKKLLKYFSDVLVKLKNYHWKMQSWDLCQGDKSVSSRSVVSAATTFTGYFCRLNTNCLCIFSHK